RPFDLDDLRARFREQQRCQRAWQQCREIHDAHPLKWSHQLPPPLVHGSLWETHRRLERVQESASGNDASRDQSGWLLPRDAGLAAAEPVFLHLAGGGLWQLLDEAHPLRRLEVGEAVAGVLLELVLGGLGAGAQDDEGVRRLAPFLVWHADNRRLL